MYKVVTLILIVVATLLGRAATVPSPAPEDGAVTPLQYIYNRFTSTCGGTSTSYGTRFINPKSPGKDTTLSNCVLSVDLVSDNICQLRLDFVNFELAQPNFQGQCETDFMTITGTSNDRKIPTLCGTNSGKHMYLEVDPTGCNPKINIDTSMTAYERSWDINVTQIECNSAYKAPPSCLQYYTESSGVVQSLNYAIPTAANIAVSEVNRHLNNQNYMACVASRPGYCSITWSPNNAASNNPYTFVMTGDPISVSPTTLGTLAASLRGDDCTTDYVMIPSGSYTTATLGVSGQADRFCGLGFPTKVVSTMQPFAMGVVTDSSEGIVDTSNVGFNLRYRQNVC